MVSSALQDTTVRVTGQSKSYFREHSGVCVRDAGNEKESQARGQSIPGSGGTGGGGLLCKGPAVGVTVHVRSSARRHVTCTELGRR